MITLAAPRSRSWFAAASRRSGPSTGPQTNSRQLPVVDLDEMGAALEGAVEARRGEVDQDGGAVGADVGGEVGVDVKGPAVGRIRVADHQQRRNRGATAQVSEKRSSSSWREGGSAAIAETSVALAAAPVEDEAAAGAVGVDEAALAGQPREQRLEHGAGLAAAQPAEDRLAAELAGRARRPDPLAAGVDMDVVATGALRFDRDRQQRVRGEDRDPARSRLGGGQRMSSRSVMGRTLSVAGPRAADDPTPSCLER